MTQGKTNNAPKLRIRGFRKLGWKERRVAELALMVEQAPYLKKLAGGREISGLNTYE